MVTRGLNCAAEGFASHLPKIKCPRGKPPLLSPDVSPRTQQHSPRLQMQLSPRTHMTSLSPRTHMTSLSPRANMTSHSPRANKTFPSSPRPYKSSPRTPRRRGGRLSAGAAFSLFFLSPGNSPRAASPLDAVRPVGPTFQCCSSLSSQSDLPSSPSSSSSSTPFSSSSSTPFSSSASPFSSSSSSAPLSYLSQHQPLSSALSSLCLSSSQAPCGIPEASSSSRNRTLVRCADGKTETETSSAETRDARLDSSESANEDLLLFFYQLDLNMRLQRALNQDQYEPAQQLREKIAEVEREIVRLRDMKLGGVSAKDDAQDKSISLLSLKAELSRAVEEEQYALAAELQSRISSLESDALAASASALASRSREFKLRLGQRVTHKLCGYKGIVAGMDPVCSETSEWRAASGLPSESLNQPFYQVLVDVKEGLGFPVAYVPEDSLEEPEEPTKDRFDHPYVYLLFYGMDANGDFIPCQQLREKYNAPRHELPSDESKDGE